eukprot:4176099-Pleurochrysis_carterae.AAC.1
MPAAPARRGRSRERGSACPRRRVRAPYLAAPPGAARRRVYPRAPRGPPRDPSGLPPPCRRRLPPCAPRAPAAVRRAASPPAPSPRP